MKNLSTRIIKFNFLKISDLSQTTEIVDKQQYETAAADLKSLKLLKRGLVSSLKLFRKNNNVNDEILSVGHCSTEITKKEEVKVNKNKKDNFENCYVYSNLSHYIYKFVICTLLISQIIFSKIIIIKKSIDKNAALLKQLLNNNLAYFRNFRNYKTHINIDKLTKIKQNIYKKLTSKKNIINKLVSQILLYFSRRYKNNKNYIYLRTTKIENRLRKRQISVKKTNLVKKNKFVKVKNVIISEINEIKLNKSLNNSVVSSIKMPTNNDMTPRTEKKVESTIDEVVSRSSINQTNNEDTNVVKNLVNSFEELDNNLNKDKINIENNKLKIQRITTSSKAKEDYRHTIDEDRINKKLRTGFSDTEDNNWILGPSDLVRLKQKRNLNDLWESETEVESINESMEYEKQIDVNIKIIMKSIKIKLFNEKSNEMRILKESLDVMNREEELSLTQQSIFEMARTKIEAYENNKSKAIQLVKKIITFNDENWYAIEVERLKKLLKKMEQDEDLSSEEDEYLVNATEDFRVQEEREKYTQLINSLLGNDNLHAEETQPLQSILQTIERSKTIGVSDNNKNYVDNLTEKCRIYDTRLNQLFDINYARQILDGDDLRELEQLRHILEAENKNDCLINNQASRVIALRNKSEIIISRKTVSSNTESINNNNLDESRQTRATNLETGDVEQLVSQEHNKETQNKQEECKEKEVREQYNKENKKRMYGTLVIDDIENHHNILQNFLDRSETFDKKHQRNIYSVLLRGSGLKYFPKNMDERNDEVIRRVDIDIEEIERNELLILNKSECVGKNKDDMNPEEIIDDYAIMLKVNNRVAFSKLLARWPENSFVNGIVPTLVPVEKLSLTFVGIETEIPIEYLQSKLLERGLVDVKRTLRNGKETTIVRANALSGEAYISILKNGVHLNPKKRVPYPGTNRVMSCQTCIQSNCKNRECNKIALCHRCSKAGHASITCTNEAYCIQCGMKHYVDSEKCAVWRERFYKENDFIIKVLIKEKIIHHRKELLVNKDCDEDDEIISSNGKTSSEFKELKEQVNKMGTRMDEFEKEQIKIKNDITGMANNIKSITTNVATLTKLQTQQFDQLQNQVKKSESTLLEAIAALKRN